MPDEKPFEATPKKLKKARKEGKVLKSPNLCLAISMAICSCTLYFLIRFSWLRFKILLEYSLVHGVADAAASARNSAILVMQIICVTLGTAGFAAVSTEACQVGIGWYPRAGRSAADGCKKIIQGLCKVHWLILKVLLFFGVVIVFLWSAEKKVLALVSHPGSELLTSLAHIVKAFWYQVLACLLAVGCTEYLFLRKRYRAELSMSLDEVRRELKDEEGDPHLKGAREQMHRALLAQQIVQRVRKSKVLIVERE